MVPYVRKSFYKHYNDGLKYVYTGDARPEIFDAMSIEDDMYKTIPCAYHYAMDMTEKEINQAVEGMYHNLSY